ncbi:MAG: phytoene/squalene synthase family protein [Deltaproteobacteria bacterium]|nr:phytoene/squalene synthase family protein [Deltaproteobacteria bacterium]
MPDADDLAACERSLREGSKTFHAAARLLPSRLRPPVVAAYAFCRVADDAIDGAESPADGLAALRERLDGIYAGAPDDHPVDRAFAAVARGFRIPRAVPEALLEGFLWDVEGRRYETAGELRAYAARVAAAVGVLVTLIMGERRPPVLARACDLGVAMQLTNIARDVGEDARHGRVYLPLDWLREAGIDPEAFPRSPTFGPALGALVERLLAEADDLYQRAAPGIPLLPADCRPAIRAARLIYADIGRVIRKADHDSVTRRAFTTRRRKLWLLLCSRWGRRARRPERVGAGLPPLAETAFLVRAVHDADTTPARAADGSATRGGGSLGAPDGATDPSTKPEGTTADG